MLSVYVSALYYYFLRVAINAPSTAIARTALPAEHPPLELPTPDGAPGLPATVQPDAVTLLPT